MQAFITIQPSVRSLFEAQGLCSFADFMSSGDQKVQQLTRVSGGVFYLKRVGPESLKIHLRTLLCGRRSHSGALRELTLLQSLRHAGFQTMEPVAWGERRRFGFPLDGFLVVRKVQGDEVANLFDGMDGSRRRRLMEETGRLIGRLHAKGFFQPVRLKDLILAESGLVLIDRETSKPWPVRFSRRRAAESLARAVRRTLRDGHAVGAGSAAAFLRGYHSGLAVCPNESWTSMRRDIFRAVRREMFNPLRQKTG
jgi:tRNA A-37 threonylcarbamoyl transferase component Bud32